MLNGCFVERQRGNQRPALDEPARRGGIQAGIEIGAPFGQNGANDAVFADGYMATGIAE